MQLNLRFISWIWHIRGSLPLAPEMSPDEAFERLDVLFQIPGTTYTREHEQLVFQKKNQPSQDKMSIFDSGILQIKDGNHGKRLYYNLVSKTLLLCFLAPALFFGFGKVFEFTKAHQATISLAAAKPAHLEGAAGTQKKDAVVPMNFIDKFLGVPEPDKKNDLENGDQEKIKKKLSPKAAYVFCGLFAFLYVIGRILEQFLIRRELSRVISLSAVFVFIIPRILTPF